jgi:hypothetical protein
MTSRRGTRVLLISMFLVGGAAALGAWVGGPAAARHGAVPSQAAPVSRGSLDADVRLASGRVIGELHGSIHRSGRGKAKFQPVPRSSLLAEVVGLRVRKARGRETIRARASELRLRLRIGRANRLVGSGRIAGRQVRVSGAGGERAPHLSAGKRMLVVGHPRGEGYEALRRRFRPVRYRPGRHHRQRFLRERRAFHSYAAIVFGPDVSTAAIRRHRLLHSFYTAGRWVIFAPASARRLAAVSRVHPHVVTRAAPAIAVRSVGREGATKRTRPTLVYPTAARYPRVRTVPTSGGEVVRVRMRPPSRSALRANEQRRQRWFAAELGRYGRAYSRPGRRAGARAAQAGAPINLPDNAAMLEIPVVFYHEHQTIGARNMTDNPLCGWNRKTNNVWCPDTWYWKSLSDAWGDPYTACNNLRAKGYTMINQSAVDRSRGVNGDGAYTLDEKHVGKWVFTLDVFGPDRRDDCPGNWSTTQIVQGSDTYYALFSAQPDTHSVLVLENVTITPTSNQGGAAGRFIAGANGGGAVTDCTTAFGCTAAVRYPLLESFYLGGYDRTIALRGAETNSARQFSDPEHPDDPNSHLVYSGSQSVPGTTIQQTEETKGTDITRGFDIGLFGDQGTLSYNQSTSVSFSATVTVPSWVVEPDAEHRQITWSWKNNRPVDFDVMRAHGSSNALQTFNEANDLNTNLFTPQSLAVWSGAPVWGRISVDSKRTLYMVDHFSFFNQANFGVIQERNFKQMLEDRYSITSWTLADGPEGDTPATGRRNDALSPGINFCDPEIRAPAFKDTCANEYATLITFVAACPNVTGSFTGLSINGKAPEGSTGTSTSTLGCNRTAHASVTPGNPATISFSKPVGPTRATIACKDPANARAGYVLGPTSSPAVIPAGQMTPRRHISCTLTATR